MGHTLELVADGCLRVEDREALAELLEVGGAGVCCGEEVEQPIAQRVHRELWKVQNVRSAVRQK